MAKQVNTAAATAAPTAAPVPAGTLVWAVPVNKHPQFKGARAAWYALMAQSIAAGHTGAQFKAAALANPPSTPKTGKNANKCEPPQGWVNAFTGSKCGAIVKITT